jgi:Tfp pilus assembly protein PilF
VSAINQMLRDLDKRGALAQGAVVPGAQPAASASSTGAAIASNTLASAYASVRMLGPRMRLSRNVMLAGGVAALLPIAWATTYFERPAAAPLQVVASAHAAPAPAPATALAPAPAPTPTEPVQPALATPASAVVAVANAATVEATPAPLAAAVPASTAPVVLPMDKAAQQRLVQAPSPAGPSTAMNRPVRAPVMLPPSGEDEVIRSATRRHPPNDTRLAMARPAAPKDETRIERRPTDARDDLTRAGEAMSIGRTSDAIALLRKVIQSEPDNERARLALLSLLAERGRDDTWRSTLADSAKALPKRFGLAAAQGLAESGRFEESLAILQSLPESIRDTRYFSALGATHQQLNQHAEAVAAFDAALGTAPGSSPQLPSLLVAQAMSMQSLGKAAEARRNLERVRQMPEAAADVRDYAARELAHAR